MNRGKIKGNIDQVVARPWQQWKELFGSNLVLAWTALALVLLALLLGLVIMLSTAPSRTITLSAGEKNTVFYRYAERYKEALASEGVKINIVSSAGSLENLRNLAMGKVDAAFVIGGIAQAKDYPGISSLGSIGYQPILIFYRAALSEAKAGEKISRLSQLAGKRIVLGPEGTGIHRLALDLLARNGIKPGEGTTLLNTDDEAAQAALLEGKVDAIFLMSESASRDVLRSMLRNPAVRVLSFSQADAYSRRVPYLNKLDIPMGGLDLGLNIPAEDLVLVGPAVEILARDDLHPALSDVILEAARKVHGSAGLLRKRNEFPAAVEQEFPISEDARRFYTSGKGLLYRYLPFSLARLVSIGLTVLLPLLIILVPSLRLLPVVYRWTMLQRIFRWYAALQRLEKDFSNLQRQTQMSEAARNARQAELRNRLLDIEQGVTATRVPAAYADWLYGLRTHVSFVRDRIENRAGQAGAEATAPQPS